MRRGLLALEDCPAAATAANQLLHGRIHHMLDTFALLNGISHSTRQVVLLLLLSVAFHDARLEVLVQQPQVVLGTARSNRDKFALQNVDQLTLVVGLGQRLG